MSGVNLFASTVLLQFEISCDLKGIEDGSADMSTLHPPRPRFFPRVVGLMITFKCRCFSVGKGGLVGFGAST